MKKIIYIPFILLAIGCNRNEPTHSVQEFIDNDDLRESTLTFCRENPGEREGLPNCINSSRATLRLFRCIEFKKQECKA